MRTRRCVGRRRDLGGLGARALSNSPDGRWQAVGDKSGVVNVYALGGESPESPEAPEAPEKSVGNLVTACSLLRWSADSQLLAAGSSSAPGALRLVHAPSFRVFANWPAQLPALVSALDFSPNSGFLALGTRGGDALLFRLLSYPNY